MSTSTPIRYPGRDLLCPSEGLDPELPCADWSGVNRTDERAGLDRKDLEALQSIAREQTLAPGEFVFHEAEPYRGFFFVESGCVKVFQTNEAGREGILSFFLPKEPFAVLPLLKNMSAYPASCAAIQESRLSFYPAAEMLAAMEARPGLAALLRERLVQMAEFFRGKSSMLMLESVDDRVRSFLTDIGADQAPTFLDLPKGQIALYLGMTPEAFSRALGQLRKTGELEVENGLYLLTSVPR